MGEGPLGTGREMMLDAIQVRIDSEVGRLRRTLVHEPGAEVDAMVPSMMEELLFDDILHGDFARDEHRILRRILKLLGVEVLEALELLVEVLAADDGRRWVEDRVSSHLDPHFQARLLEMDPREMAVALVGGVRGSAHADESDLPDLFGIRPLPNWCFQRDTQVVMDSGVLFTAMASYARRREATLSQAIFRFHPRFSGVTVLADIGSDPANGPPRGARSADGRPALEGGDVLVLSDQVILVGHSERTNKAGIHRLVQALTRRESGPRRLLMVALPHKRAYMHLDTVFTPLGPDAALVYPPVILPGNAETVEVWEYDLHRSDPEPVARGGLLGALTRRGLDYEPIFCGGDDAMMQQREQWTDGANALALAPNVVVLYDRNVQTAEAMDRKGYRIVRADALLMGSEEVDLDAGERVCLLTPSNELSRARGGPHCLTHPLWRDKV